MALAGQGVHVAELRADADSVAEAADDGHVYAHQPHSRAAGCATRKTTPAMAMCQASKGVQSHAQPLD